MKKFILSLGLLSLLFTSVFSQEVPDVASVQEESSVPSQTTDFNHNVIYASYGLPSFMGLLGSLFVGMFSFGQAEIQDSFGVINVGYDYYFNENLAVGGVCTLESLFDVIPSTTIQVKGTAQYGFDHFKFYHALSAGVFFDTMNFSFMFDLIPLGLKLYYDDFDIFLETSLVSTGIIKLGVDVKF